MGWRQIEPNLGDPDPPLNGLSHKPGNVMPELKGNRTKGDPHTLKLKSGPAENNARARHRKPLKTNKNPVEEYYQKTLKRRMIFIFLRRLVSHPHMWDTIHRPTTSELFKAHGCHVGANTFGARPWGRQRSPQLTRPFFGAHWQSRLRPAMLNWPS